MPCLLVLGLFWMPRVIIVLLVIFGDYIGRAFDSFLWPLLGFIFAPTTTLAWAWMTNTRESGSAGGVHLVIVALALLVDLGVVGGGRSWFIRRRSG